MLFSLLTTLPTFIGCADQKRNHVKVESPSGKAPFTVRLTGPNNLLDLGQGHWQKWVGCGYEVLWGDGPNSYSPGAGSGSDCSDGFKHTYHQPGTYTVKVSIWHPGPDDAPRIDWSDTATITVSKK